MGVECWRAEKGWAKAVKRPLRKGGSSLGTEVFVGVNIGSIVALLQRHCQVSLLCHPSNLQHKIFLTLTLLKSTSSAIKTKGKVLGEGDGPSIRRQGCPKEIVDPG
jgi:hypothetical protein